MSRHEDDHDIRTATALVHAVPGATMEVGLPCGASMVVGRHPAADVSPCEWRRFLLGAQDPGLSAARSRFRLQRIGGVVAASAAGSFVDRRDAAMRWLCTGLGGAGAAAVLRDASADRLDPVSADAVSATIRPDAGLGVTVVGMRIDAPCLRDRLEDLAITVLAELLVAELAAGFAVEDREV